jgi:hypothetical protein
LLSIRFFFASIPAEVLLHVEQDPALGAEIFLPELPLRTGWQQWQENLAIVGRAYLKIFLDIRLFCNRVRELSSDLAVAHH